MRLIDADDFKKFLQALCKAGAPYEDVITLLDRQETAYDVEAKVTKLEKKMLDSSGVYYCGERDAYKNAIEIIREKE